MHPVNGLLRFALEMAALGALGYRGWTWTPSWGRYVLVVALPLAAAAAWGTFAVLDDPSRSGNAPVVVPGMVRLAVELVVLGLGAWAMAAAWRPAAAVVFGGLVVVHYAIYWERVVWLLKV